MIDIILENFENNCLIEISKEGFTTTTFLLIEDVVYFRNREITGKRFEKHPATKEEIKEHIKKLYKENFEIRLV